MKKILILNGSPHKNGNTAGLIRAFADGAKEAGNEVTEFYLQDMMIKGCLGCMGCMRNGGHCIQQDDMAQIADAFVESDVIVFATPIYFGGASGTLKTAVDRFFPFRVLDKNWYNKECALLSTAGSPMYDQVISFYEIFTKHIGWKSLGMALGTGQVEKAYTIGVSIA